MRGMRTIVLLGLAVAWQASGAWAGEPGGRRAGGPTDFATLARPTPATQPTRLGHPVPLEPSDPAPPAASQVAEQVPPAAHEPEPESPVRRLVRAQIADFPTGPGPGQVPPPPPPPPPGTGPQAPDERYLCAQVTSTSKAGPGGGPFANAVQGVGGFFTRGEGRALFQSDHAFDQLISPVTAPFLAEDPRALTEVRPIFIYQHTPGSIEFFRGGTVGFFGAQARVALTDRFSLVLNKLGWVWTDPHDTSGEFQREVGFAEIWFGPKFTIIRNDCSKTLLAAGLTFQLASGSHRVAQDTGDLTLAPYVSFAQSLPTGIGAFNFMNTTGYAFATDNQRTDYFYTTFHFDYDFLGWHRFYPLVELNWVHYTQNGGARNLSYEGRDLFNFGSRGIAGHGDLSLAFGARYKFCEGIQLGAAIEFPLQTHHDLNDYRVTVDMIFRY